MPIPIKSFIFPKFGIFQNIPVFEKREQKYFGFLFEGKKMKINTGTFISLKLLNKSGVFWFCDWVQGILEISTDFFFYK